MPRRMLLVLLAVFWVPSHLSASPLLDEGEKLILENKLREASVVLEQALKQEPAEEKLYLYLGVIYEQLGEPVRAVAVMSDGLAVARGAKPLLAFNIANSLFKQGDYAKAESMYSQALALDATLGDAYLNRANTRLRTAQYPEAVADYVMYLRLDPASEQRPQIERVVALLRDMVAAAEQAKQADAARQKALMDDVLNSLKNASADAKNIGAASEKVQVDFQASNIED
jgi:tetratricopeptide (TPR) repeat protein